MSGRVKHFKSKGRTRSERVRARSEVKERLGVSGSMVGVGGAEGSVVEEALGMEEIQTNEAAADVVQLVQEVVQVNDSQNEDEVIVEEVLNNALVEMAPNDSVEEVLNNALVEMAPNDSIEVVMETHNPVIDLTEAEDEVVLVSDTSTESKTKVGKSVEIDLTSSPMPAPGPPPMQCPVCFDSLQSLLPPRTALSTKCGHLFCSSCLPAALQANGCCPTCRKRVRLTDAIRLFL